MAEIDDIKREHDREARKKAEEEQKKDGPLSAPFDIELCFTTQPAPTFLFCEEPYAFGAGVS